MTTIGRVSRRNKIESLNRTLAYLYKHGWISSSQADTAQCMICAINTNMPVDYIDDVLYELAITINPDADQLSEIDRINLVYDFDAEAEGPSQIFLLIEDTLRRLNSIVRDI